MNMELVTVWLPKKVLEILDELVRRGDFPNRSEAIRFFIREGLRGWLNDSRE